MPIEVQCQCGKRLRARDELAGKRAKCPGCGHAILIPSEFNLAGEEPPTPPPPIPPQDSWRTAYEQRVPPRPVLPVQPPHQQKRERSWRGYVYWLLLLLLIPLALSMTRPHVTAEQRLDQTIDKHPELAKEIHKMEKHGVEDIDEFFAILPGEKLEGAWLARHSGKQWLCAAGAAILFFAIIAVALPGRPAREWHLLLAGLFTGTLGVMLLIGLQYFGIFCFCCLGAMYRAALDPRAPFGASLLGFFFGVGFCEELIKSLPILWLLYRYEGVDWRQACVLGMASGAGFGISEGIHYCTNYYNGIESGEIYLVRFISCAGFHTMLSAACGILLQRKQHILEEGKDPWDWVMNFMAIITVPILLHGLFDTLAKKNHDAAALGVAVISFLWLAWLIASSRKKEQRGEARVTTGHIIARTARGTRIIPS